MLDSFDDSEYDYRISKGNRRRRIEDRKTFHKVNSRGLITVILPLLEKRAKEAKKRDTNDR